MTNAPNDSLRHHVTLALANYHDVTALESSALASLAALWPLPADYGNTSLTTPRRGIAVRALLKRALANIAPRFSLEHAILNALYIENRPAAQVPKSLNISRATLYRQREVGLEILTTEIATLNSAATEISARRIAAQTAFLPGIAPDEPTGIEELLDAFLQQLRARVIISRTPILLTGLGGIGKTTIIESGLRIWLTQEQPAITGVLYQRIASSEGAHTNIAPILDAILQRLNVHLLGHFVVSSTLDLKLEGLAEHLNRAAHASGTRYVIVLDDIENDVDHAAALKFASVISGAAIVVLASRQAPTFQSPNDTVLYIHELERKAAERLVKALRPAHAAEFTPAMIRKIVDAVGGHPLALQLVVGQYVVGMFALDEILEGLRDESHIAEKLYRRIYERAWAFLSDTAKQLLRWLTNYPDSGVFDQAIVALKAHVQPAISAQEINRAIDDLANLNLLQRVIRPVLKYSLHRLTYQFIEYKTGRDASIGFDDEGDDDTRFFADDPIPE